MKKILLFFVLSIMMGAEPINNTTNSAIRNEFLEDRAKGYLLNGKAKTAVTNYGNFITWDYYPAGFWGNYGYIPHLSFIAGIPGHEYSSTWLWNEEEYLIDDENINVWSSADAYNTWVDDIVDPQNGEGNFSTIVYNTIDDRGDIASQKDNIQSILIGDGVQWVIDHNAEKLHLYLDGLELDPNLSSSRIGLAFPWAIRPKFVERTDNYDLYDYGNDNDAWTDDDDYVYYGANTAESWFVRDGNGNPQVKTDWQASKNARDNTHNQDVTVGELFGNTPWTDPNDYDWVLAHSIYQSTWPSDDEPYWPGFWGEMNDDDSWQQVPGQFISDTDVYMEFDDRWGFVANEVEDNEYVSSGYSMGIRVMVTGHSYGVNIAEDIMFFTMKVRNESGDFCAFEKDSQLNQIPVLDENGVQICGDAMEMPDGSRLNSGNGFNYNKVSAGFYFDADVLSNDVTGGFSVHTNGDDFMRYIDCHLLDEYPEGCPEVHGNPVNISMAVIGDWDGVSNSAHGYSMETDQNIGTDFGVVAVQLLDTPYASDPIDLNQDGYIDIYPGEKLNMTDWHWFDWYNRPGVVSSGNTSDTPALNKELIQYQLMAGDTTNLTLSEKARYFHTANPQTDLDSELNPHFDSLEGLEETSYFQNDPDGLDCLFEMSSGPFDLEVGEEVNLSFVVLFGGDMDDLKFNAETAQMIYNNHYKMFTAPISPDLMAASEFKAISVSWDSLAEGSIDIETGLQDFEGYRIYRSTDNGVTWGDPLYNNLGELVSWQPYLQFDLDNDISGPDPAAPWFNLGDNTGLSYNFIDSDLYIYQEYCYTLTAYDSGVEAGYETSWGQVLESDFPSTESNIGHNMICNYPEAQPIYQPPTELLFLENESNIGWSHITYLPHSVDDEYEGLYKFEIHAEIDTNTFLNSETLSPELFVYEVDEYGNQISEYLVQNWPIYSIDDEESEYNWLDILGMYVKIENLHSTVSNPMQLAKMEEVIFSDTTLSDRINIKMRWNSINDYQQQPYFDYQIEFGTSFLDTAANSTGDCSNLPIDDTPLPFRITNLTLNNQADLWHHDSGIYFGQLVYGEVNSGWCTPVCEPTYDCIEGECIKSEGYKNCNWEHDERLDLREIVFDEEDNIYELKIGFDMEEYYNYVGANPSFTDTWVEGETYLSGEIVYHEGMLWEAAEDIAIDNPPDEWFDNNNDYINDNSWKILYPWEDGDIATFTVRKLLHDGDSWLVDMSKMGDCSANLGDVNDDGNLDILDLVKISMVIIGNEEFDINHMCFADINEDGVLNILDLVQLVNLIFDFSNDFLVRSISSEEVRIITLSSAIRIDSEGTIGGLQLNTTGTYDIREIALPEGWEFYKGNTGLVIINLTGKIHQSDIVISYNGEMRIINHLASDLYGNKLLSRIVGAPMEYTLNNAYPNPFNPVTTISYGLPMDGQVKIILYDLMGRQVDILYNDIQHSGYHQLIWDASSYASGMYFVQLIATDFIKTQKLMLVK